MVNKACAVQCNNHNAYSDSTKVLFTILIVIMSSMQDKIMKRKMNKRERRKLKVLKDKKQEEQQKGQSLL